MYLTRYAARPRGCRTDCRFLSPNSRSRMERSAGSCRLCDPEDRRFKARPSNTLPAVCRPSMSQSYLLCRLIASTGPCGRARKANARCQRLAATGFIAGSSRHDDVVAVDPIPPATVSVLVTVFGGLNTPAFIATKIKSVAGRPSGISPKLPFVTDAPVSVAERIRSVTDRILSDPGQSLRN